MEVMQKGPISNVGLWVMLVEVMNKPRELVIFAKHGCAGDRLRAEELAWEDLCTHRGCIRREGIRREGTRKVAPEALRYAVGGGCQGCWGRLLSVTNVIEPTLAVRERECVAGYRLAPFQCNPGSHPVQKGGRTSTWSTWSTCIMGNRGIFGRRAWPRIRHSVNCGV